MKRTVTVDLFPIISFVALGLFAVNTWKLSRHAQADLWWCFGIPASLMAFELFGFYDSYKKRRDTLPKELRLTGIMNFALFSVSAFLLGFTR